TSYSIYQPSLTSGRSRRAGPPPLISETVGDLQPLRLDVLLLCQDVAEPGVEIAQLLVVARRVGHLGVQPGLLARQLVELPFQPVELLAQLPLLLGRQPRRLLRRGLGRGRLRPGRETGGHRGAGGAAL